MSALLVTARELAQWADTRDAQGALPQLIRRLVAATCRPLESSFRSGDGVHLPGWDGRVKTTEGNAFVPTGSSAWEMGCSNDPRAKAESDYAARCGDALGLVPSETTYVFVTPRVWPRKDTWADAKRAEGFWRDVRAFDAADLETWLEAAPAIHLWISSLLGTRPSGAEDLLTYWEAWASATAPALTPDLIRAGRGATIEALRSWLDGPPGVREVRAQTRDEATAFVAAALLPSSDADVGYDVDRAIVVHESDSWSQLAAHPEPLLLIAAFQGRSRIAAAATGGHHVLIPLARDEASSPNTIDIPRLHRVEARKALESVGIDDSSGLDSLSRLARTSLAACRRRLAISRATLTPSWGTPSDSRRLVAAVLAGQWSETHAADKEAVEALADEPYEDYQQFLLELAALPDPPLQRIGAVWTVVAKDDTWDLVAPRATREHLERFEEVCVEVLSERDPRYDLPHEQRWCALLFGKATTQSADLRRSLADSTALLGATSNTITSSDTCVAQYRVDRIVQGVMSSARDWQSLASVLPFAHSLAEASPDLFLDAIESFVSKDSTAVVNLFCDQQNTLGGSPHTALQAALEVVAWSRDHLSRAALALARLAELDPGGGYANRPQSSLRNIFLLWKPRTSASLDDRVKALDRLRRKHSDVAWKLMTALMPKGISTAYPTCAPRRRDWTADSGRPMTYGELHRGVQYLLPRLRGDVGTSAERWSALLECIEELDDADYAAVVDQLSEVAKSDTLALPDRLSIWTAVRELIARHREFPSAEWAFDGARMVPLESVYRLLAPSEPVKRVAWLFSANPMPPEGIQGWEARRARVAELREETVLERHAAGGLAEVHRLATEAEYPAAVGYAFGRGPVHDDEVFALLSTGLGSDDPVWGPLASGAISGRMQSRGPEWLQVTTASTEWSRWSPIQRADVLIAAPFHSETWDAVDGEGEDACARYWSSVCFLGRGELDSALRDRATQHFMEHGLVATAARFLSLYTRLGRDADDGNPELSLAVLERLLRPGSEKVDFDWAALANDVRTLLKSARGVGDAHMNRIALLEWVLLPLVRESDSSILRQALREDPAFFIQLLELIYKSESTEATEDGGRNPVGKRAWDLLSRWPHPPGADESGKIDAEALTGWVREVRAQAADKGLLEQARYHMGEALACVPDDKDGIWPHTGLRQAIEEADDRDLEDALRRGVVNSRGAVMRAIGEGGVKERALAARYREHAAALAADWPSTARLLRALALHYEDDARRVDARADLDDLSGW